MTKVTFERVARFPGPTFRVCGHQPSRWVAATLCDLARPGDELVALALLTSVVTRRDAWVDGGRLAFEEDGHRGDVAWPLLERTLHARLGIARAALDRAIAAARESAASTRARVAVEGPRDPSYDGRHRLYVSDETDGRRGYRYLRHPDHADPDAVGSHGSPDASYGEFAAADGTRHGMVVFRTSSHYDGDGHAARTLAAAVAGLAHPGRGISPRLAWDSHDFDVAADGPGIEEMSRIALPALSAAREAVRELREGIAALPWGGDPTAFAPEDDDARDLLAAELRAGARIRRVHAGDPLDDAARWSTGWREAVPAVAVRLLVGSGVAIPGEADERSRGRCRPPLVLSPAIAGAADPVAAAGAALDAFLAASPGLDASRARRGDAVEVAGRMAAGKPLRHEDDDVVAYVDADGSPLATHVVDRLRKAGLLEREGDRYAGPWCPATLAGTESLAKAPPRVLAPRSVAVGFAAFRSYCGYRCGGDGRECRNPGNDGYDSRCEVATCPITERAYDADHHGTGRLRFDRDGDPAWGWEVEEDPDLDLPVTALHPNTARSPAFRSAGLQRVEALVRTVANAMLRHGAPFLVERCHDAALDEAVAAGHLVVTGDLGAAFGRTARPGPGIMARIDELRAEAARAAAAAEGAAAA